MQCGAVRRSISIGQALGAYACASLRRAYVYLSCATADTASEGGNSSQPISRTTSAGSVLREPCTWAARGGCRSLGRPSGKPSSSLRFNQRPAAACRGINITSQWEHATCLSVMLSVMTTVRLMLAGLTPSLRLARSYREIQLVHANCRGCMQDAEHATWLSRSGEKGTDGILRA